MGSLGTAFDIVIVGALALPVVLLVIHLFFSDRESGLKTLMAWVKDQNQPTLVSVLLFAMAFPMGSAVSRIAQDFFDDDDLHVHIPLAAHDRWYRVPIVTETSIRTDVFCQMQEELQEQKPCQFAGGRLAPKTSDLWQGRQQLDELAERVTRLREAAVLLQGTDATEKLRQYHDQIMVLRGAAFNAMVAFFLCFYWWSARFNSRLRWAAPAVLSLLGLNALYNHLMERPASDPPYMEFTLLVLAAAGWYLLRPRAARKKGAPADATSQNGRGRIQIAYLFLAAFLASSAFLGWWSTQVLYDQQVFYSYRAFVELPRPAPK